MKRIFLVGLCLSLFSAHAQLNQGGFVDGTGTQGQTLKIVSPYEVTKISETQILPDDSLITLEGYIVGPDASGDAENFIFKDNSGSIVVDIDNKLWRGQIVTPETKIKILGELDVSHKNNTRSVDVKYLTIIE